MTDPADIPDPASAHLGLIREIAEAVLNDPQNVPPAMTARLLAEHLLRAVGALDGVLELAVEWDIRAAGLWSQVDLRDLGRPSASEKTTAAAALRDRARDIRATVSRGLTEGGSDA